MSAPPLANAWPQLPLGLRLDSHPSQLADHGCVSLSRCAERFGAQERLFFLGRGNERNDSSYRCLFPPMFDGRRDRR